MGIVINPDYALAYFGSKDVVVSIWAGNCWTLDFFYATMKVSITVTLALFAAVFLSKIVAVLLPMSAAALKKDPAIVSQPLLTTVVDVSSLLIYFLVAYLIILQFVH